MSLKVVPFDAGMVFQQCSMVTLSLDMRLLDLYSDLTSMSRVNKTALYIATFVESLMLRSFYRQNVCCNT